MIVDNVRYAVKRTLEGRGLSLGEDSPSVVGPCSQGLRGNPNTAFHCDRRQGFGHQFPHL